MQMTAFIVWGYGALVLMGGVMGWVKARSKPSLISGMVFGVALLASGVGVWQGNRQALVVSEALAVVLLLVFLMRFAKTRAFMPAGLMVALSLVAVGLIALGFR